MQDGDMDDGMVAVDGGRLTIDGNGMDWERGAVVSLHATGTSRAVAAGFSRWLCCGFARFCLHRGWKILRFPLVC